MIGISIVYGVSGIYLNHLDGTNPAYKTITKSFIIEKDLTESSFIESISNQATFPKVNKVREQDSDEITFFIDGGTGVYDKTTGEVSYEIKKKKHFVYWVNKIHYNSLKNWKWMGDFFAVSLIFFAVSGIFMVRGKNGIAKRGKWYLIAGLIIPILYIILG